jgi:DNA polymerase III alpha subunit
MIEPYTELNDRVLRFDGVSIVSPEQVKEFFLRGAKPWELRVPLLDEELEQYNSAVAMNDQLRTDLEEDLSFDFSWKIPEKYLSLDIAEHVQVVFSERLPSLKYDSAQVELAINRVALELQEFETRGLQNLLRTIIYVLDRFHEAGQVFGVGRGSSCASYILFLLGLHVVDPVIFEVPLDEFMH